MTYTTKIDEVVVVQSAASQELLIFIGKRRLSSYPTIPIIHTHAAALVHATPRYCNNTEITYTKITYIQQQTPTALLYTRYRRCRQIDADVTIVYAEDAPALQIRAMTNIQRFTLRQAHMYENVKQPHAV